MRRVDVEENTRNDDRVFLEELFEERLVNVLVRDVVKAEDAYTYHAVVDGSRKLSDIEPDVECGDGRNMNIEVKVMKTFENVITLGLEMRCESQLTMIVSN